MGLRQQLKKRAVDASHKLVETLLADEQRALTVARALGSLQRGKQTLDRGQVELLRALSFAPQADYKAVGKQLSGLKRRLRELDERLAPLVDETPGE